MNGNMCGTVLVSQSCDDCKQMGKGRSKESKRQKNQTLSETEIEDCNGCMFMFCKLCVDIFMCILIKMCMCVCFKSKV